MNFFSLPSSLHEFFLSAFSLAWIFFGFGPPHHFSNGPSLSEGLPLNSKYIKTGLEAMRGGRGEVGGGGVVQADGLKCRQVFHVMTSKVGKYFMTSQHYLVSLYITDICLLEELCSGRGGGLCPKGYGFCAFLVWNGYRFCQFLVLNRVWFSRELQECMNVFIVSIPNK